MRKPLILTAAALSLLSLAACGQKARNEAAEANEALAGDSNTMGEAVADVNGAAADAFANAEASYDSAPVNTAGLDTSVPDGDEVE